MKLQLYYPHNPHYIFQKFGETAFLQYYKDNGINFKGHNGLDIVSNHGDPIYASHDGEAWYEIDSSQGHGVVVRTNEKFFFDTDKQEFLSEQEAYNRGYKEDI